eukprot:GEMP01053271.1.p1 GENE.GEMP01053271.1~~GEMP01053271.1.p1  ORF type:complete len:307 (+),score=106.61 GEMP01053271.1:123-1043(+)
MAADDKGEPVYCRPADARKLKPTDPIVFLDIDGVLNQQESSAQLQLKQNRVKRLGDIFIHVPNARIVLTSIVGKTEEDPTVQFETMTRRYHISRWLSRHGPRHFCILDDRQVCDSGDSLLPYFIRTDARTGITADDAQRAIQLLRDDQPCPIVKMLLQDQPVIFLDIDGVLNQQRSAHQIFLNLETVAYILKEVPDATVVLSTFWRGFSGYIEHVLSGQGLNGVICGATYEDPTHTRELLARKDQIRKWLKEQGVRPFVILDDRPVCDDKDADIWPRFIHTKSEVGLTMDNARAAVSLLKTSVNHD